MVSNRVFVILLIILSSVFIYTQVHAAVIDVPADEPTIQSGIDAAKNGDTVLVADGIYRGAGNVNIDFKGKQITVKSQNGAKETIIDCESNPDTRGFIFQNKETNDSVLDGVTIRNGVHDQGGGIYIEFASPMIKNCVIERNQAVTVKYHGHGGGGIFCLSHEAIIKDCTIKENIADSGFGGGIILTSTLRKNQTDLRQLHSEPKLINCKISENTGSGILCIYSVDPVIQDCQIYQNKGCGVDFRMGAKNTTPLSNCLIEKNTCGGVKSWHSSLLRITESVIQHNSASIGAGILCHNDSRIEVHYSVIANNTSTGLGGGICVNTSNCDIIIDHCTITQNYSSGVAGGIFVITDQLFSLTNSIVWDNKAGEKSNEGYVRQFEMADITVKSCVIKGGFKDLVHIKNWETFSVENIIEEDPLFVDADNGDYKLSPESPAMSMGAFAVDEKINDIDGPLSVVPRGKQLVTWADIKRR